LRSILLDESLLGGVVSLRQRSRKVIITGQGPLMTGLFALRSLSECRGHRGSQRGFWAPSCLNHSLAGDYFVTQSGHVDSLDLQAGCVDLVHDGTVVDPGAVLPVTPGPIATAVGWSVRCSFLNQATMVLMTMVMVVVMVVVVVILMMGSARLPNDVREVEVRRVCRHCHTRSHVMIPRSTQVVVTYPVLTPPLPPPASPS
jgi:hypothetical protein